MSGSTTNYHHVYKAGYSVLPQLTKIAAQDVFLPVNDRSFFMQQKQIAMKNHRCFIEQDITDEIYRDVCDFIVANYPDALDPPYTFQNLAQQMQEDLAIHRMSEAGDWLAATHVCFPSGWSPEETVGKSFNQIHEVIPGMKLTNSRKLVHASIHSGPYERFVWGILYEHKIDCHPSIPWKPFDPNNPFFLIKVERQVMYGLPQYNAMLFVLRHFFISEADADKPALLQTVLGMTTEQKEYKGITQDFIDYLAHSTTVV